jgi:hypothetical protein
MFARLMAGDVREVYFNSDWAAKQWRDSMFAPKICSFLNLDKSVACAHNWRRRLYPMKYIGEFDLGSTHFLARKTIANSAQAAAGGALGWMFNAVGTAFAVVLPGICLSIAIFNEI